MEYERVIAADIQPGDRVARARTHRFREVVHTDPAAVSVWLYYDTGGRDRPRLDASWWREVTVRCPPADIATKGA